MIPGLEPDPSVDHTKGLIELKRIIEREVIPELQLKVAQLTDAHHRQEMRRRVEQELDRTVGVER